MKHRPVEWPLLQAKISLGVIFIADWYRRFKLSARYELQAFAKFAR